MDIPPPRGNWSEREVLVTLWQYHRESFVRTVDGVSDDDARRAFVPSGTTLLWLAQHLAFAEQVWLCRRYSAQPFLEAVEYVDEPLADAVARLRRVWSAVDEMVARSDLESTFVHEDGTTMNLRWVVAHLLEEVARHAGHADIIRELIDGAAGR